MVKAAVLWDRSFLPALKRKSSSRARRSRARVGQLEFFLVLLLMLALTAALTSKARAANDSPQSFTYQGKLTDNSGNPLLDQVNIKLGIYSADGLCLLYEELDNGIDLVPTSGLFSINIGTLPGNARRTGSDPGLTMAQVFANAGTAIRTVGASNCAGGYTPAAGDVRMLRVTVTPISTGVSQTLAPDQTLASAPQALVAQSLQGFIPTDFIQINNASQLTQANAQSLTNGSDASSLHSHDSLYAKLSSSSSQNLGSGGFSTTGFVSLGASSSPAATQVFVDSNAAATKALVVQGAAGQTANLQEWQQSNGAVLSYIDNSGVFHGSGSGLSGIDASQISAGTLSNSRLAANVCLLDAAANSFSGVNSFSNSSGAIVLGPHGAAAGNTSELRFKELAANGSNYVSFKAPNSIAGNVTWTLPSADGNSGDVLQTNGSGALSWVPQSGGGGGSGGVTNVTASSPLASSGGATPQISIPVATSSADGYLSSTDWSTFNGKAGGAANLTNANTLTQVASSGVVSEASGLSVSSTANVTKLMVKAGSSQAANNLQEWQDSSGNVLASVNNAGKFSGDGSLLTNIASATNFSGSLSGDVTGTQSATVVSQVGGASAANVATTVTTVTAATNANTASTLVKRDASGNFSAGTITASLTGAASLNVLKTGDTMTGSLKINTPATNDASAQILASAGTASNKPLVVQGAAAQSAALQEWQDSSGNVLASINNAGKFSGDGSLLTNIASATNFSGSLSGDVTGTQSATVVSQVGGASAANVATTVTTVTAATNANTASTLVKRDASGNFSAGTITASLTGAASLNVLKTGDTMSGVLNMGSNKISNLADPTANSEAATRNYVSTAISTNNASYLPLAGGTMTGAIAMGNSAITGLAAPSNANDAATKNYVDTAISSFSWATPGTIGSTTPNTGAFTTLSTSSTLTLGGNVASSGNPSFDFSGSSGTFKTSTGANTLSGNTTVNGTLSASGNISTSGIFSGNGSGLTNISANWAAPGTIGSTTPNTGAFTTLSTSSTLTLGGNVTTSGNLNFDLSGSTGTFKTSTGANTLSGNTSVSGTLASAKTTTISTGADASIGLVVKGNSATQSANLQEWQKSDATVLASVDKSGHIKANHLLSGGSAPTAAPHANLGTTGAASLTGTDSAHLLTITSGNVNTGNLGTQVTVTFATAFASAPVCTMTPSTNLNYRLIAGTANATPYLTTSATGYTISSAAASWTSGSLQNTTYIFNVICIGN